MMWRTPNVLLALVLLLCGLRTGLCVATVESTAPEPGSFIDDFEGARNINLFCDIRDGGNRIQTVWSIQTAEDVEQGADPGPIDSRFVLSGDIVMSGTYNISLNTNLTLLELTADLDQAIIFCGFAENPLLASFTLRIYKPPALNNAGTISKKENEEFSLDLSEGNPPAFPFPSSYMWSREGGRQLVNETGQREYNYSSVFIRSVQLSDSGDYTLTATNRLPDGGPVVGTDTGSFSLNVLFGANLTHGDVSVAVAVGENVTLVCGRELTGNPIPQIEWKDNLGSSITGGGRFIVSSGREVVSLTIANTVQEDSGNWTCSVQVFTKNNELVGAKVQHFIKLLVVVAPGAPRDIQTSTVGSTFTTLLWVSSRNRGFPELSRHIVLVSGGGMMRNVTVEGSEPNTNVTGLLPGTEYTFRVVAVSVYGDVSAESPPSNPLNVTLSSVPSVECTQQPRVEDTELVVSWSYGHTGGLNITSVLVEYWTKNRLLSFPVHETDTDGSGTGLVSNSTSLPLLVAGVRYVFQVTATNEWGSTTAECPGLLLNIGIPATPEAPSISLEAPNEITVLLSTNQSGVNIPSQDEFHFTLQFQVTGSNNTWQKVIPVDCRAGGGECSTITVLTELSSTQSYVLRVRASNRYGTSEVSAPVLVPAAGNKNAMEISINRTTFLIIGGCVVGVLVVVVVSVLVIVLCALTAKGKRRKYIIGEKTLKKDLGNSLKTSLPSQATPISFPMAAQDTLYAAPHFPEPATSTFSSPAEDREGQCGAVRDSAIYEEIAQQEAPEVELEGNLAYSFHSKDTFSPAHMEGSGIIPTLMSSSENVYADPLY